MTRRRADRGAAAIEWTGALGIVAVLVVAIAFASRVPVVGGYVRWAVCQLVTIGQGPCESPAAAADTHAPTQPCVTSSNATTISREITVLSVKGKGTNRYEIAHLSDGRIRVTELNGAAVGVEAGVGAGVNVTVSNDSINGTFGASATAQASALLGVDTGRVWYVTSQSEANRLISNLQGNAIKDVATGGAPIAAGVWNVGRWLVDQVTGHDSSLPPADETYAQGGLALNASAEATAVVLHGSASIGASTVLGARTTTDGQVTVYLRSDLDASASAQILRNAGSLSDSQWQLQGGQAGGTLTVITALTVDSAGHLVNVTATGAPSGQSAGLVTALFGGTTDANLANQKGRGLVYQATLPIQTQADALLAAKYLAVAGIAQADVGTLLAAHQFLPVTDTAEFASSTLPQTVAEFVAASKDRGVVTQQSFSDNSSTYGAAAELGAGIEVGGGASVDILSRTSNEATYWDGTAWVPWAACQ